MSLRDPRSIHCDGVPDLDYEELILNPVAIFNDRGPIPISNRDLAEIVRKGIVMKIKITQIEHTGIDPEHYSVGDIVNANRDLESDMVFIDIPGSDMVFVDIPGTKSHYVLLPKWFKVVGV